MREGSVIFVPGKNPKPPAEQHRTLLWKCLLEGVRRADLSCHQFFLNHPELFQLCAWNALYYSQVKDASVDLQWIDELIHTHGASEQDIAFANHWDRRLARLLYSIADQLPMLVKLLPQSVRSTIVETNRYFTNHNNIACDIRELLKAQLRPLLDQREPVLLIAHSLGSVIAYDSLWELSHEEHITGKVELLLTIGSPLGMKFVQERLNGRQHKGRERYPACIRHWVNIASTGDLTALDRKFADDFRDMLELNLLSSIEDHCDGIYNFFHDESGLNCHRSYGYLVNPAVGKVIADFVKKAEHSNQTPL